MKKKHIRYSCYTALSAGLSLVILSAVACNKNTDIPKMSVSYGPEVGFADGNVNLSGDNPIINISDIKAEVGMNIDYLSGVTIANEADFPDLEIWIDASSVDIFTAGNYTVEYTFVYGGNTITKAITVTLIETEQSASDTVPPATTKPDSGNTDDNNNDNNTSQATTKPNQTSNNATTKPNQTSNTATTKPNQTSNTATTKPNQTSNTATTKPNQTSSATTTAKPTTTRQIITTVGNNTTESKNIGNYTIELLSGDTITIKNTTGRYIVSTRTDIEIVEENGCTYRISKLVITYNTGFEHILETVKDRIK